MKLDGQFKFLRNNNQSQQLSPVVELFFDEHFYEVIQRFSQGCTLFCFFVIVRNPGEHFWRKLEASSLTSLPDLSKASRENRNTKMYRPTYRNKSKNLHDY